MTISGPILIIEDDIDDQVMIKEAFDHLKVKNKLEFFNNGADALHYLQTTSDKPFIILTDINMPKLNGLELREVIHSDDYLRRKSIPFIFLSTTAYTHEVDAAYDLTVQGFFEKPRDFGNLLSDLELIVRYWQRCQHPSST